MITLDYSEICVCGMPREQHPSWALTNEIQTGWAPENHTEPLPNIAFGNLEIPSHDNFLEAPSGMVCITPTVL